MALQETDLAPAISPIRRSDFTELANVKAKLLLPILLVSCTPQPDLGLKKVITNFKLESS